MTLLTLYSSCLVAITTPAKLNKNSRISPRSTCEVTSSRGYTKLLTIINQFSNIYGAATSWIVIVGGFLDEEAVTGADSEVLSSDFTPICSRSSGSAIDGFPVF